MAGFTVVDSETVMATHLSHAMQAGRQAPESHRGAAARGACGRAGPKLIEEVVPKMVSITTFQKVLQLLLEESVYIHDIRTIIETLAEHAASITDPELARRVRIALAPAIVQQIYGPDASSVIAIEPGLERLLVQALSNANGRALDPGVADLLTHKAAEVALKREELGMPACLLVPGWSAAPSPAWCAAWRCACSAGAQRDSRNPHHPHRPHPARCIVMNIKRLPPHRPQRPGQGAHGLRRWHADLSNRPTAEGRGVLRQRPRKPCRQPAGRRRARARQPPAGARRRAGRGGKPQRRLKDNPPAPARGRTGARHHGWRHRQLACEHAVVPGLCARSACCAVATTLREHRHAARTTAPRWGHLGSNAPDAANRAFAGRRPRNAAHHPRPCPWCATTRCAPCMPPVLSSSRRAAATAPTLAPAPGSGNLMKELQSMRNPIEDRFQHPDWSARRCEPDPDPAVLKLIRAGYSPAPRARCWSICLAAGRAEAVHWLMGAGAQPAHRRRPGPCRCTRRAASTPWSAPPAWGETTTAAKLAAHCAFTVRAAWA